MTHDWLLVETLGSEPAVVAQGRQTKNLVPISAFLRRNPNLMAIQTAIGETVRAGKGLSSITPKNDRVIRTEVVQMSDGVIHGVQVWVGPPDMEPPERPTPGPLIWDLSRGVANDTPEALFNSGWDPENAVTHGRAFAEDLPRRDLNPSEAKVLSMAIKPEVGQTFCSAWDVTDFNGEPITVGFVARVVLEAQDDGKEQLICRAMNWRSEREGPAVPYDYLAQRILHGLAQPGVYRVLVDLKNWTLLKWLDEPVPFFDWRAAMAGDHTVHPDDHPEMGKMATEFVHGAASGVLRMAAIGGGWTPVHVTVNRVELEENIYAGLATLREPTAAELAAAGLSEG
ncbi:PAS domain-containing protein [Mycobacterium sp.]|uniref:PAS domain-containing protein n=1 Tax=Mycobacterium sp. TaxID=1785 RepID=UPI002D8C96F9|nr:PAS domain-containing protein [Mycobacterium sp.]